MQRDGWNGVLHARADALRLKNRVQPVPLPVLLGWSEQLRAATFELRAACVEARAHARDLRLRSATRARPQV